MTNFDDYLARKRQDPEFEARFQKADAQWDKALARPTHIRQYRAEGLHHTVAAKTLAELEKRLPKGRSIIQGQCSEHGWVDLNSDNECINCADAHAIELGYEAYRTNYKPVVLFI